MPIFRRRNRVDDDEIYNQSFVYQSQTLQEPVKPKSKPIRVGFKVMNNCAPVPVAKPADFIQLTPIVQPVPLVPYSTQLQPMSQFLEDDDE